MNLPPPFASNPRVLTRVMEHVAAGNRRVRGLAEALDLEPRVIHGYLAAGNWLGFLDAEDEPGLTRAGLVYVYAGPRRPAAWAEGVATHPWVERARAEGAEGTSEMFSRWIRAERPELTPVDARRRGAAARRLLAPAWRRREPRAPARQVDLGLPTVRVEAKATVDVRAGTDDSPDVYAVVLRALLDAGELSPAHVRGVLDAAGGSACGIGGAIAMAVRRGDARREGDVLVVTAGACARRELAESAVSVAFSDPDFRRWLGRPGASGADDRRFRPWATRLFGAQPVERGVANLLFGRSLSSFPEAGDAGAPCLAERAPFLAVTTRRDLCIAFPSSLEVVRGGVAEVNRLLRATQQQSGAARPPTAVDMRRAVHGGLMHPGEPPVRAVPDMVALRARALTRVPAFALLAAVGFLDRRGAVRMRVAGADVKVDLPGRGTVSMDAVVDAVATARGWSVCRGPSSLRWGAAASAATTIGLLVQLGAFLTLDEALFRRMQGDPEHRDLMEGLIPLADVIEGRLARLNGV